MSRPFHDASFEALPLVGILRGFSAEATACMIAAAVEGGLLTVEVTMNTAGAADMIAAAVAATGDHVNVGAGTVCTMDDLHTALQAGASFIVSPIVAVDVITECVARGVPVFPGAMTPTEIFQAARLGARMVKVFPAPIVGPEFIKLVLGPLDDVSLLPTGGITLENMADYFHAGAKAVGIAGPIFNSQFAAAGDWNAVRASAAAFVARYQEIAAQT